MGRRLMMLILTMKDGLARPMGLEEVELTGEELHLATLVSDLGGRRRELIKCRGYSPISDKHKGGVFYLVVDANGGAQFNSIEELREFIGEYE
jgi:hypothetical protein